VLKNSIITFTIIWSLIAALFYLDPVTVGWVLAFISSVLVSLGAGVAIQADKEIGVRSRYERKR